MGRSLWRLQLYSGKLLERFVKSPFFDARVEALVNTVNTVGVMGKGLALEFKRRFPMNFEIYAAACRRGEVQIGRMLVVKTASRPGHCSLINFPTKKHWRQPSKLAYVEAGLEALVREVQTRGIRSLAVPPLGCGNGGLAWEDVRPLIDFAIAKLPGVHVLVFSPEDMRGDRNDQGSTTQLGLLL